MSAPADSSASAEIVGLFLEAIIYGFYFALASACLLIFLQRRKENRGINYSFELASIALFICITCHLVIDIVRLLQAYGQPTLVLANIFYTEVTTPLSVLKTGIYVTITVISDAFMLYRTYAVWNRSLHILIIPMLLFLSDIGTGVAAVVSLGTLKAQSFFIQRQARITEAFFATTLTLNGLCTVLIAFRIWKAQHDMSKVLRAGTANGSNNLNRVIVIVLESGAIYSVTLLLLLSTYVAQSTAAFKIFLDILSPVIGLVFSLIIVRVSLGFRTDGGNRGATLSTVMFANQGPNQSTQTGTTPATYELRSKGQKLISTTKSSTVFGSHPELRISKEQHDDIMNDDMMDADIDGREATPSLPSVMSMSFANNDSVVV